MIVFDLDGTLVDSIKDITTAMNLTLNSFGMATVADEVLAKWVGVGIAGLIHKIFADAGRFDSEDGLRIFNDYYLKHVADQSELYPGTLGLIESNERKVILTNKSNIFVRPLLQKLDIERYFEGIFGRESFPTRKPDPGPLLMIAQQFHLQPHQMIMVGDTEIDIVAGQRAGTRTCAVTYGYGEVGTLTALKPDFIAHNAADLRRVLDRCGSN
jgi:phosphoglycolate phosphatase